MLLAPAEGDAWMQALPPPIFKGNEASKEAVCLKGDAFRQAVLRVQVTTSSYVTKQRRKIPRAVHYNRVLLGPLKRLAALLVPSRIDYAGADSCTPCDGCVISKGKSGSCRVIGAG